MWQFLGRFWQFWKFQFPKTDELFELFRLLCRCSLMMNAEYKRELLTAINRLRSIINALRPNSPANNNNKLRLLLLFCRSGRKGDEYLDTIDRATDQPDRTSAPDQIKWASIIILLLLYNSNNGATFFIVQTARGCTSLKSREERVRKSTPLGGNSSKLSLCGLIYWRCLNRAQIELATKKLWSNDHR